MDSSVPASSSQGSPLGELDDLFAQLEAKLRDQLEAELKDQLEVELKDQLEAELKDVQPEQPAPKLTSVDATAAPERRFAPRRTPEEFSGSLRVTVPGAADAQPINLSETGFLMETSNRLRPGSVVEVFLRFNGVRQVLRATIVRSVVHSLTPKPLFRTAFKFEEPTKLPERP